MNTTRLVPRQFQPDGRLQMAEGRLSAHRDCGTDLADVFIVHHYPQLDGSPDKSIELVDRQGISAAIGIDDIRQLPGREVTAVLECAGNGRGNRVPRSPGNQFGLGLFAQSTWRGASLRDVLALAEFSIDGARQVVVMGADEGLSMPENSHDTFGKGLPLEKALHPDTIVAWEVDGGRVPSEHGGPLRLVVPGWYGIWWVKWPSQIRLQDEEFTGFWQNERYTYQDESGKVLSVVKGQMPRAILKSPLRGAEVIGDKPLEILAWAGEHRVTAVEVSVDDGNLWSEATKTHGCGEWGWSSWTAPIPTGLPRGLRRVAVRARDDGGRTQAWQPEYNRLGYGNNGIHTVEVDLTSPPPSAASEVL